MTTTYSCKYSFYFPPRNATKKKDDCLTEKIRWPTKTENIQQALMLMHAYISQTQYQPGMFALCVCVCVFYRTRGVFPAICPELPPLPRDSPGDKPHHSNLTLVNYIIDVLGELALGYQKHNICCPFWGHVVQTRRSSNDIIVMLANSLIQGCQIHVQVTQKWIKKKK